MSDPAHRIVHLGRNALSLADLAGIARDPRIKVECEPEAFARVATGWAQIQSIVDDYKKDFERLDHEEDVQPALEYGVTTGFGEFKDIPVAPDELEQLQRNILLSHSVGVGENADRDDPSNYFAAEVVRAALVIRLNAFLKGYSGVRLELVRAVAAMLNQGIVPLVPLRGSVGSSGDLCPLSHLFVVLLGQGQYRLVAEPRDLAHHSWSLHEASRLEMDLGMKPPQPSYKEGLALTNGATFSAALLALAVYDGEAVANTSDIAAALSLEAVCGCARALDPRVHEARSHAGQIDSAANIRSLVEGSRLMERAGAVQDVYSLRCAPQVHGAARDALAYARMVVETEIEAATDNPLFFPGDESEPWDRQFQGNEGYSLKHRLSYSAGNFHGEPVGMAADFLAIGLAELANISERRIQMLLDSNHNRNLPGNLIPWGGLNSGYMIAQYCAAGIVSENKVLSHPASVDSIPTSANSEDHNAMATIAARKLRTVLHNVQAVLAIELLVAAQAIEWRVAMGIDPQLKEGSAGAEAEQDNTRPKLREDRVGIWLRKKAEKERQDRDFRERTASQHRPEIAAKLAPATRQIYLKIRELAPPLWTDDRTLDEDIRRVREVIEDASLLRSLDGVTLRPVLALRYPRP